MSIRGGAIAIPCRVLVGSLPVILSAVGGSDARASSHREAPFVTENPKVDATDFYMFRSYEPGRDAFVTLIANYLPLQDPYGGPNYFTLDPDAVYDINIDNDGDAKYDVTFRFRFQTVLRNITLDVGNPGEEIAVAVPLVNVGPFAAQASSTINVVETFQVEVIREGKKDKLIEKLADGSTTFDKPVDNIGNKSIPNYDSYAAQFVYDVVLPGGDVGRMFVGQRKDPFVVNLGETFDLVNLDPVGAPNAEADDLADKNVTSLILEIPTSFLLGESPILAGNTTASLRKVRTLSKKPAFDEPANETGSYVQVSRLGSPLVNEVVIGLPDKNRFNASSPKQDAKLFATYVTNPTLPELLQALFGVTAPNVFPRTDLLQIFVTGIPGLTEVQGGTPSEMLRLNTSIAITSAAMQDRLGVLGGDMAGYANGRRPGDDVVDISLRAVMGVLLPMSTAPSGQLPYTDGAIVDASFFDTTFPYLKTPLAGSPN